MIFERRRSGRLALTAALAACTVAGSGLAYAATTTSRTLSASGELKRIAKPGPNSAVQRGTITGSPFGSATMVLRSTLKQARVTSTFTVTTAAGVANGRATARLTLDGDTATYKGTATITGGTRRYKGITGADITFRGVGPVSAKSTRITLTGSVRF